MTERFVNGISGLLMAERFVNGTGEVMLRISEVFASEQLMKAFVPKA